MDEFDTTGPGGAEQSEAALRQLPGIAAARVLDLEDAAGRSRRVAWLAGPGALSPLPEGIAERHGLDRVAAVARLAPAGRESDALLAGLPLWDVAALERLAEGFRARDGVADAAVAALPRSTPRFPSRRRLTPDGRPASGQAAEARGPSAERAEIGRRLSERDAVAEGAPLVVPADHPRTLAEALERAAATDRGISYLDENLAERRESYAELRGRALRMLGGLRAAGAAAGDILLLDTAGAAGFLGAFWACVLGGMVPAPIALPDAGADPAAFERLRAVWAVLGRPRLVGGAAALRARALFGGELAVVETAALGTGSPAEPTPARDPGQTAVIILTSGSTGTPKGVCQRHAAILSMSAAARQGVALERGREVFFNWMPLDHVGGFVFLMAVPVILASDQVHAPTAPILAEPLRWVELIDRHRVTVSWAPNFAFSLIADAVGKAGPQRRDLACLKALYNGGEAVTEGSLRAFEESLAPQGLKQGVMRPSFGMSETCAPITLAELGHAIGPFASLGAPVPGSALRIAGEDGRPLKEGEIGRLELNGPQIFAGYHGRPDLTGAVLRDGWFDTGDVGFLAAGRLYLTGRLKDSLIVNGAKFFAHEIEAVAAAVPGIERAGVAAVPVRAPGSAAERVAVFFGAPPDAADDDVLRALALALRGRLARELGLSADYLIPVGAAEIPRTGIGKIQRPALQKRFAEGAYDTAIERVGSLIGGAERCALALHRKVWMEASPPPATGPVPAVDLLVGSEALASGVVAKRRVGGEALAGTALPPGGTVVHLAGCEGAPGEEAYRSLLALGRAVATLPAERRPRSVLAAVSDAVALAPGEPLAAGPALIPGLLRSLALELPEVRWRVVDLPQPELASLPDVLAAESAAGAEPETAWRRGRRFVARFEPLDPPVVEDGRPPVRPGDLWLVTGGLGGIGRAAARRLLGEGARLLLIGRSERRALPAERAEALAALETLGEVGYAALDVGDREALAAAVAAAEAEAGRRLAGMIHLAGVGRPVALQDDDGAELPALRRAALDGLAALATLLDGRPEASLTVAGSIVGRVGGHVPSYAAVNAAAAETAGRLIAEGRRVSHLAFSSWTGVGMSEGRTNAALLQADGLLGLEADAGLTALEAALRRPGSAWLVGLDGDHPLHAAFTTGAPAPLLRPVAWLAGAGAAGAERHADALGRPAWVLVRPVAEIPHRADGSLDLGRLAAGEGGARVAPRDEAERRVAAIFAEVLSIEEPAVDDDFFLAGGTSLLAGRLAARLSSRFFVELPVGAVFRQPTVEGLTRQLRALEPQPGMVDAVARQLAVIESLSPNERAAMQARLAGR